MKKQIVKNELKSNESGITLLTLVIMLIVMLILLSVATYSGLQVVNMSNVKKFATEMGILQSQINKLNSEKGTFDDNDGEAVESGSIYYQDLSDRLDLVSEHGYGNSEEDKMGYRYFTPEELINDLGIEGVDQAVFINLEKKEAVSYDGVKYKGEKVYVIEQVPSDLYFVEYEGMDKYGKPTFDTEVEEKRNGSEWDITITNIQYSGNINKWTVQYKLENAKNWSSSSSLTFTVDTVGNYIIKIVNGNIESDEKIETIKPVDLVPGYIDSHRPLDPSDSSSYGGGQEDFDKLYGDHAGEIQHAEDGSVLLDADNNILVFDKSKRNYENGYSVYMTVKGDIHQLPAPDSTDEWGMATILGISADSESIDEPNNRLCWFGFKNGLFQIYSYCNDTFRGVNEEKTDVDGFRSLIMPEKYNNKILNIQITGIHDGYTSVYFNGQLFTTFPSGSGDGRFTMATIGDLRPYRGVKFTGNFYDIGIYNKVLTPDEVERNWNHVRTTYTFK